MKGNAIILFCLSLFALAASAGEAQARRLRGCAVKLCTYNIRGDMPRDRNTVNAWSLRRDSLCGIILRYDFDIVCMQEVLAGQLADIERATGYAFVGSRGFYNPVFYKADRFELLHTETFWLSESMEPFSKGWDAKYDRYCTWAHFRDRRCGEEFMVFNTHLDHRGAVAKREGAALVCREAERIADGRPFFICGDMNSFDTTDAYAQYTERLYDARKAAANVSGPVGTAHNFGKVEPVRIDYIFVNDRVKVMSYDADDESYPNGMYPSDHYAVFIDAVFTKKHKR